MRPLLVLFALFSFLSAGPQDALASKATPFRGAYKVLGEHGREREKDRYVVVDVDTVAALWAKYGDGDLPESLVKVKDEPAILSGFTFRTGLFFNLESNALITDVLLAVPGGDGDLLNLKRLPDGNFDLGVRLDGVVAYYSLGPREELGQERIQLPAAR